MGQLKLIDYAFRTAIAIPVFILFGICWYVS